MQPSNVLVHTGRKGCGKDYLVQKLIENGAEHLGFKRVIRVSFSDELRELAHELFPWCPLNPSPEEKELVIEHPANALGLSPRGVWKRLADDNDPSLRKVDPEILVNRFKKRWDHIFQENPDTLYAITDWRTPQEEAYIIPNGWPRIRIIDGTDKATNDEFEAHTDKFEVDAQIVHLKTPETASAYIRAVEQIFGV